MIDKDKEQRKKDRYDVARRKLASSNRIIGGLEALLKNSITVKITHDLVHDHYTISAIGYLGAPTEEVIVKSYHFKELLEALADKFNK